MKIGFNIESEESTNEVPALSPVGPVPQEPVRSLVQVRFENDGRTLTYYNDLFALAPGDRVFVSGKLAGMPGIVVSVTTKFKINLANYEKVISMANMEVRGSYEKILDKMVSYDSVALSPDQFRAWCMPPKGDDVEIITGDGYDIALSDMSSEDEISQAIFDRAIEYCRNGNVAYISMIGGTGTAFVFGTEWYEINFRLESGHLVEMYCDCPYPGLCKHLVAVAIIINGLTENGLDIDRDFVAVDDSYFWRFAAEKVKKISL
jgi:hypothetical protein